MLEAEVICLRDGRPMFDDFSYRSRLTDQMKIDPAVRTHPVTFVTWNVLDSNRADHINRPLTERKIRLQKLIKPFSVLIYDVRRRAEEGATRDLEVIVAKRKDSTYQLNTRSVDWVKVKNWKTIDMVILGYRLEPQFALVVGLYFPTVRNKPVAVVKFRFKPEEKAAFRAVAQQIHTKKDRHTQWIEPHLCCRIQ